MTFSYFKRSFATCPTCTYQRPSERKRKSKTSNVSCTMTSFTTFWRLCGMLSGLVASGLYTKGKNQHNINFYDKWTIFIVEMAIESDGASCPSSAQLWMTILKGSCLHWPTIVPKQAALAAPAGIGLFIVFINFVSYLAIYGGFIMTVG